MLNNGKNEYEEVSSKELSYKLSIQSKNDVSLYCSQEENTTKAFGSKCSFPKGGLRICVFENATGNLISCMSIYESKGELLLDRSWFD